MTPTQYHILKLTKEQPQSLAGLGNATTENYLSIKRIVSGMVAQHMLIPTAHGYLKNPGYRIPQFLEVARIPQVWEVF